MASILKHLRSSTANKRPTASGLADGQIAINTASGTPGMFFKDSDGVIVKVGPLHVGSTAPNTSPAGSAGNSKGELWVDDSLVVKGLKYYDGSSFNNLTPSGTTTTAGLLELATPAETQAGSDGVRAVTPSGLQSKISDSTSTVSSITIASATAVKSAYDLANAALPKTGGTVTGEIIISPSGSLAFEGSTDNDFETRIVVVDPTADRTITIPNTTGTLITSADNGTVTSTMIADGTIVDADINASAAIGLSKLATGALPTAITVASANIVDGTIVNADINAAAAIDKTKISGTAITAADTGTVTGTIIATGTVTSSNIADGTIVNADVNASAAIAGTKISPNFGSQTVQTTGIFSAAGGSAAAPSIAFTGDTNTGIYSPGADQVAVATNGTGRLFVNGNGNISIGGSSALVPLQINSSVSNLYTLFDDGVNARFTFLADTTKAIIVTATAGSTEIEDLELRSAQHIFSRTAAIESARIDSSRRLLIGTSSSSSDNCTLQVRNDSGTNAEFFRSSANDGGPYVELSKSRGTAASPAVVVAGDLCGAIAFRGYSAAAAGYRNAAFIEGRVDGEPDTSGDTTDMPGRLVFSTTADGASSPTERMRIWANGAVSINTTTQPSVSSFGTFIGRGGNVGLIENRRNVTGTEGVLSCGGSTGQALIMGDGDLENTNNSYGGVSDAKLKENIADAAPQWEDIKRLQVRKYNFKEQTGFSTHTQIGLVAQEVELVSPGLVSESPDRDEEGNDLGTVTKSVNYSVLYMKAVKALQEAMERIETLEQRLNDAGIN